MPAPHKQQNYEKEVAKPHPNIVKRQNPEPRRTTTTNVLDSVFGLILLFAMYQVHYFVLFEYTNLFIPYRRKLPYGSCFWSSAIFLLLDCVLACLIWEGNRRWKQRIYWVHPVALPLCLIAITVHVMYDFIGEVSLKRWM